MQKKRGQKAQAMNSAELAALVDHAILPNTLEQFCDAKGVSIGSPQFDALCKLFAQSIGLEHLWPLIMYPFALSADNCQKHPWVRKLLLRPRLRDTEWNALEFKLQRSQCSYVERQALKAARRMLSGVAVSHEALVGVASLLLNTPGFCTSVLTAYEQTHGMPYKMKRLRKLMVTCPWLRIVFPHQFMPLTPITPDIHQPIEHRVLEVKIDVNNHMWKIIKDGEDTAILMLARTYQEAIIESAQRRSGDKGKEAIAGSIRRMLKLVRILRANKEEFAVVCKPRRLPDGTEECTFELVKGTAGAWGPSKLS